MSVYLYGVILDTLTSSDFGTIGFNGARVQLLSHGTLSALVCQSPKFDFLNLPKEEVVRLLLSHQRTLEMIMPKHFILPFKFGTILNDEAEVKKLLQDGRSFLTELAQRMQGCTEIDVVATWEVKEMLQDIAAQDPEITQGRKNMALGQDPRFIGMLLAEALKKRACEWRETIAQALKKNTLDQADHDLLNDEMVLNSSFLIAKKNLEDFYRGVEEADLIYKGSLKFRCVGPLPPYSFATVTIKRFDPDAISLAARLLHLNEMAELSQVKKVYKEMSRECHPDVSPLASQEAFARLKKAYMLIADYCRDGTKSLQKDAVTDYVRLDVYRSSEDGLRAA